MTQSVEFKLNRKYYQMMLWAWGLWSLFIIGIPFFISCFVIYRTTKLSVDSNGVTYQQGWLKVAQRTIPFKNINSVDVTVGPIGRKYGYGDVAIHTGNDVQAIRFKGVDRPEELKRLIEQRVG